MASKAERADQLALAEDRDNEQGAECVCARVVARARRRLDIGPRFEIRDVEDRERPHGQSERIRTRR